MHDAKYYREPPDTLACIEHFAHELRTLFWNPGLQAFVVNDKDRHTRQHLEQERRLDLGKSPRHRRAIISSVGMFEHGADQEPSTLIDVHPASKNQRRFRLVDHKVLITRNQLD